MQSIVHQDIENILFFFHVLLLFSCLFLHCFGQLWSLEGQNAAHKMKENLETEKETVSVRKQNV